MFRQTKTLFIPRRIGEAWLNKAKAAIGPGPLESVKVRLWQNEDGAPNANSILTDFTQCDFTGYAQSTDIVWGAFENLDNETKSMRATKNFVAGALASPGQTAFGYYLYSGDWGLVAAERFEQPVLFAREDDFLSVDVVIAMPGVFHVPG